MAITIHRDTLRPIPLVEERSWVVLSACRDIDSDLFFSETRSAVRNAKRVCAGCAVVEDCLDYALEINIRFGVWGGMSTSERTALLRDFAGTQDTDRATG